MAGFPFAFWHHRMTNSQLECRQGVAALLKCGICLFSGLGAIMRRSFFSFLPVSLVIGALIPLSVLAQQARELPPDLQPLPEDATPTQPAPTQDGPRITEKRVAGQVTESTVQYGNSQYTVPASRELGSAQTGDAQSTTNQAPRWKILEFDLRRPRPEPVQPAPGTVSDAPPPLPETAK